MPQCNGRVHECTTQGVDCWFARQPNRIRTARRRSCYFIHCSFELIRSQTYSTRVYTCVRYNSTRTISGTSLRKLLASFDRSNNRLMTRKSVREEDSVDDKVKRGFLSSDVQYQCTLRACAPIPTRVFTRLVC